MSRKTNLPLHSETAQGSARSAAPGYGEGNAYILREVLGLPEEEVRRMLSSEAFADVPAPGV